MPTELELFQEQAIVGLFAVLKDQGVDLSLLQDQVHELLSKPDSEHRFIDDRKVDEIDLVLALAYHRLSNKA